MSVSLLTVPVEPSRRCAARLFQPSLPGGKSWDHMGRPITRSRL